MVNLSYSNSIREKGNRSLSNKSKKENYQNPLNTNKIKKKIVKMPSSY